ncbi:hypothetical protein A8926_5287 [Saccharopolyspora spinosa]|uniref:Uncharacterized protein n=1 Tax=Saccharopolyspora spinosa TaxID=60894 RepID=A0A2N3Y349_SACSN|nr:hypothetical protein A8926_5287 [Saccharopolyspora spinosa]
MLITPTHHDLPSARSDDHGCLGTLDTRADSPQRQGDYHTSFSHSLVPTKQSGDPA